MRSETTLKPCPFCGGRAMLRPSMFCGGLNSVVRCGQCGACGETDAFESTAIEKWNTRYFLVDMRHKPELKVIK